MSKFEIALKKELEEKSLALPSGFNNERFVHNVTALFQNNTSLKKWMGENPEGGKQVLQQSMRAAFLGLDFMNKEAYLVPYGKSLDFSVSYTGMKKLAKKYAKRPVTEIYAKVVKEGDVFQERIVGGSPTVDFTPLPFNTGKTIGAFAVAKYSDGGMVCETMNIEELEKARSKSRSRNSGPWVDWTDEMYKKVVIRRLCKGIELDFETAEQQGAFMYGSDEMTEEQRAEAEIEANANKDLFVEADVVDESGEAPF